MDSPLSGPSMFAARAAYFGDAVCFFCDHRNPGGAKFCSDCGSPLDLKGCNRCDAVNRQTATSCYKCGAEFPALVTTPGVTPVLPAADPAPGGPTQSGVDLAAIITQTLSVAAALRANWRLSVLATILIAGAYAAHRINAATPDAMEVASQKVGAGAHNASTAASAVPMAVESKPLDSETTADIKAPMPTIASKAPELASVRQIPAPVLATKRSSAHPTPPAPDTKRASTRQIPAPVPTAKSASGRQRPVPELRATVGATPPVTRTLAAASVGAPDGKIRKTRGPDPWQAMHVSLARCGGDLIARIACDQRVRRHFCEGHWGEAPQCASGIANDHGQ